MTDGAIPPVPPAPPAATAGQGQNAAPQAAPQTSPEAPPPPPIRAAPAEEVPFPVSPQQPVKTEGRIITRTAPEQLTVRTPEGDITVKTPARLPPGTEVTVELYLEKNAVLANIAVTRRLDQVARETQALAEPTAPPPQLKPGASVDALRLPPDAAPQKPMPPPLPGPVQALTQLKALPDIDTLLQKLPPALPVPKETLQSLFRAPDIAAAFTALPAPVQKKIAELLQSPLVRPFLPPPPPTPQAPPATDDAADANLLHILRAQGAASLARTVIASDETPAPAFRAALSALLPVIEDLGPASFLPSLKSVNTPLPQNIVRLDILKVLLPEAPAPGKPAADIPARAAAKDAPAPLPPAAVEAEVESFTAKGHPILRVDTERKDIPLGTRFVLRAPAEAPIGARVILVATPATEKQLLGALKGPKPFDLLSPAAWPALEEALPALPPDVRHSLPAPTERMTPAALLFLAALRMGEVENWLGAATLQTLRETGKRDLAQRLTGDFGKLADQAKDALPSGWRVISMPFLHDETLSQLQFFFRRQHDHEKQGGGEDGPKNATRFLLNLSLSRMGDMQLDGYLRKKQLDMILRTDGALNARTRQEITQRFHAGLGQAGLEGALSFQAKRQGWVTVGTAPAKGTLA